MFAPCMKPVRSEQVKRGNPAIDSAQLSKMLWRRHTGIAAGPTFPLFRRETRHFQYFLYVCC